MKKVFAKIKQIYVNLYVCMSVTFFSDTETE